MRNPFRAAARVATAPVRLARHTARLLQLRARGEAVLVVAEEAEADPRLYRDPVWWSRLMVATGRLAEALPLAQEARRAMKDVLLKVGVVAGGVAGLAGYLTDQGIMQLLPPKYAATIGIVCGIAGTVAAYLHPAPTQAR